MEKRLMDMQKAFTIEGCSLQDKVFDSTKDVEAHWHNYIEMEILIEGNAIHNYNGNVYNVSRGHAFITNYFDFHAMNITSKLELLNICFSPEILYPEIRAQVASHTYDLVCNLDEENLDKVQRIFNEIKQEQEKALDFSSLIVKAKANEIAAIILRNVTQSQPKSKNDYQKNTPLLVQRAVVYVYNNFKKDISLKSAAKELFVSQNYLGLVFKKSIGMTFGKYLSHLRIRSACALLESTSLNASEIAFECGYGSVEYFFASFKKYLGTTPAKYRSQKAADNEK